MARYAACRLCNLATDTFVDIFNEDGISRELGAKMASCLQILVSSEDAMPKTVCLTCCNKLNDFYEFYKKSHEVQGLLKDIYASRKYVKKKQSESADENAKVTKALQNMNQDNNSPCNIAEVAKDEIKYVKDLKNINSASDKDTVCSSIVNINKKKHVELEIKKFKSSSQKTESESDEEDDPHPSSSLQNKKDKRKKDPNLNDVPVNPRQIGILDGYPWTCTMCTDLVVDNVQELCKHYKLEHCQSAIFRCVHCEKQYDRYRSFVRHFKQHRDPKKYTCNICSKSFTLKTVLRSHAIVHSNDRPHVCTVCGKSFKNYKSLTVHNKMHLPDEDKEKFPCKICQKEFSTRHTLELHLKVHTGERNFMCDICGKSFIAKGSLIYHLLSHTDDRSHVCQTCGKTFKTDRLLSSPKTAYWRKTL
ncbi:zinc finger protein 32 isoform X2 [Cephus cinctus]|uniref:Zinc finger protein 32 isoform X2 n=1 Tax=Cephus cinctus TaxID=211228 RepID=A0AAJ7RAP5_CEPCN|nr:zinc finger protein 32 isoform X2 [Cephus cinctus]